MMPKPSIAFIVALVLSSAVETPAQNPLAQNLPMPPTNSPVGLFRTLLETNAAGREQYLAAKSPEARRIIEAKLQEYEKLTAGQREVRLRSLQLRWQTSRLMKLEPAQRTPELAIIPPDDRTVVEQRLDLWKILPWNIRQEALSNDAVMSQLAIIDPTKIRTHDERKADLQRQQLLNRCQEFLKLPAPDQNKALAKLSVQERSQMEKTLAPFSKLSGAERKEAAEGFKKFAELSPNERDAFLKTAARWRTMSEADRALWRKIVTVLQSQHGAGPPHPGEAALSPRPATVAATNP